MAYCLDANVFIQAHRLRYPMDVHPGIWDALAQHAAAGELFSIQEVYRELQEGQDELAAWASTGRDSMFRANDDEPTQQQLATVGSWLSARKPAYRPEAIEEFLRGADPWLVAYCRTHGHVLVTEEIAAPESVRKVKLPDVAIALAVTTISTNDMWRRLGARFILGPRP